MMLRGRFQTPVADLAQRMNASVDVDERLIRHDIVGSLAHCQMLAQQGLIAPADAAAISTGLRQIAAEAQQGLFRLRIDREDVHMNVEATLTERIGPAAGRLHTGRSRNDQIALDLRLYLRTALLDLLAAAQHLQAVLLRQARAHLTTVMPGYTHLQRAQPVTLAHHWLAYVAMLGRDHERLQGAYQRVNVMPLGSGALAATPLPIDRAFVARLLAFPALTVNSQDAVASRDHVLEILSACAIAMTTLSRLCEELVIWSSQEFGFVELPDAFCTGSSLMPQKRNPDIAELVRGKSGRVVGDFVSLLVTIKGLPLAYNKDLQEDRRPLFDALDTLQDCYRILAAMLAGVRVHRVRMSQALDAGYVCATDLADALVRHGVPFRDAHETVARLVAELSAAGQPLSVAQVTAFLQRNEVSLPPDLVAALDAHHSVAGRNVPGGPAPVQVVVALRQLGAQLKRQRGWCRRARCRLQCLETLLEPERVASDGPAGFGP